jgi:hypothetical protein
LSEYPWGISSVSKKVSSSMYRSNRITSEAPIKGAYILSPLQETSRDPLENYGFMINYRPSSKITTRITTYSIRNQPPSPSLPSSLMPSRKGSLFDSLKPSPSRTKSTSRTSLRLSKVLSNAAFSNLGSETAFVAFKALPVDGNIGENGISEGSQSPIVTARSAKTCKESVDIVVETIRRVCIEVGTLQEPTAITEGDIVRYVFPSLSHRNKLLISLLAYRKLKGLLLSLQRSSMVLRNYCGWEARVIS